MPHFLIKACLERTMARKLRAKITMNPGMKLAIFLFMKAAPIPLRTPMKTQSQMEVQMVPTPLGKAFPSPLVQVPILGTAGSRPTAHLPSLTS